MSCFGNLARGAAEVQMPNESNSGVVMHPKSKYERVERTAHVRFSNRPPGSSTFRLSATPVWMSLTGSRFSSDSAPRPNAWMSSEG